MSKASAKSTPPVSVAGNQRRFVHEDVKSLKTSVNHQQYFPDNKFEPFPLGHGAAPYRMDLSEILHPTEIASITAAGKLVFHSTGDTGNFKNDDQLNVAYALTADLAASNAKFLYHLGDEVYDYGEDREYPDQFYEVYQTYGAPIVGIPGNHDGSRFQGGPASLVGFMNNFCDAKPRVPPCLTAFGVDFGRDTMNQPNPYWTLTMPFATIIGLYTNVPSGGQVQEPQISWFNNEMKAADPKKKLIVALHHPVHSVAQNVSHRGSTAMRELLENACVFAKRVPDLVLCGHVHNYQNFTAPLNGKNTTFIVAGCGGHAKDPISMTVQSGHPQPAPNDPGVTVNCATNAYVGFLRLTLTWGNILGEYIAADSSGNPISPPIDTFRA